MKCQKCNLDFPENEIESSHDIPKYLGGKDEDGRHWLCKDCHKEYEDEVLKLSCMVLIKNSSEEVKSQCKFQARLVRNYFFKENTKDGERGNDSAEVVERGI